MATDVVMPQMGESIAEGTIVRWIKKIGDAIDKDEPLFEISTDKVDAEIPAPGAGVLLEIRVKEGETVPVNSIVAVIGAAGEKPAAGSAGSTSSTGSPGSSADATGSPNGTSAPATPERPPVAPAASRAPAPLAAAAVPAARREPVELVEPLEPTTLADLRRTRSSPLVRKIAAAHDIDISQLNGTGISGRVTKKDILAVVESGVKPAPKAATAAATAVAR